jgi:hypothetical protein
MEWSEVKSTQVRRLLAAVGASAVAAMGVLAVLFSSGPTPTEVVNSVSEITLGETTTETTAPVEPMTTFFAPPVTAEPPEGFGMG